MVAARKKTGGKKKRSLSAIKVVILIAMFIAAGSIFQIYRLFFTPMAKLQSGESEYLYIPTGATFDQVVLKIQQSGIVENPGAFEWLARQMEYPKNVRPGKYKLERNMNAKDLVILLRSGRQTPVSLKFHNIRTKEDFAGRIALQIEADSVSLIKVMNDNKFIASLNKEMNDTNVLCVFLPNTYEFWWNTSAESFMQKMYSEYDLFWNDDRKKLAESTGLNPIEVSILASIVQQETVKVDEMPVIAGVYLNRYKKNWKLQADPTLIYASKDYSIRRVLNVHKAIDSPFNTYMYAGLPPGPICIPSLAAVKSVLNYERHDYMYFCAKEDFSGYHSFASSYTEHLLNARKFQRALDKRNIKS